MSDAKQVQLPAKIRVGAVDWDVEQVPFIEIDQNRNYNGVCRRDQTRIEIGNWISEERKKSVFVHELVHACLDEAGYNEHDEDMVERFSNVLLGVIRDNDLTFLRQGHNE